jgi:hypothetical protein
LSSNLSSLTTAVLLQQMLEFIDRATKKIVLSQIRGALPSFLRSPSFPIHTFLLLDFGLLVLLRKFVLPVGAPIGFGWLHDSI